MPLFQHPSGQQIRERGDLLNLTDMWRAAGAEDSKRPAQWVRLPATVEFIVHVMGIVGLSHIDGNQTLSDNEVVASAIKTERGGTDPGTWAHWQIGLAYAKYLSPAFHVWCNQIIRDHMLAEQTAKLAFHDKYVASDETYNLQAAARLLSTEPNKFLKKLRDDGYLFYQSGKLQAKAQHLQRGLFRSVIQDDANGVPRAQLHMTALGVAHFNGR